MQRKIPWWSVAGVMLVLIGIAGYNYWAYNCGYCALQDMKTVGPQARAVGYLVLGAAVCWFLLYFSRSFRKPTRTCRCGRETMLDWCFCPDCGDPAR